uniref:PUM-HD domain-containing protein n=1 Tax=Globodera pallida TaxID=36090 RepID=A0A183CMP5_GLOPA
MIMLKILLHIMVQHVQTVRVAFLHQCAKNNVCPAVYAISDRPPSHRSKLLDAYHNKRTANLQLIDLGEHVVAFALDPQGSRFIQQKLERANPTEKAQLVDALRGHVLELAQHMNGSHVIRKALETIINEILTQVIPLSLHKYGCWVIECVLEHCTHKRLVLEQLHANVATLVTDQYGNHVIQHINSLSLHEYGNLVVQRLLEHCTEQQKRPVLEQLLDNVPTLVMDKYGSFVIQHMVEHGRPEDRERIVRSLQGDIMKHICRKAICNIIEKCLIFGTTEQKNA